MTGTSHRTSHPQRGNSAAPAVAPTHQFQGIGSRLLTVAREEADRLGAPLLFLEGDPGYYSAQGWRAAGELDFVPPSARIPGPAFQVMTLSGYDPTTMRGALIYNDTFWSRDCVGLRGTRLAQWDRPAPLAGHGLSQR